MLLSSLLIWSSILLFPTAASGGLLLQPGQDLTSAHAEDILTGLMPEPSDTLRYRFVVNSPGLPITNRARGVIDLRVSKFDIDERTKRFNLMMSAHLDDEHATALSFQGQVQTQERVVVLRQDIMRGSVLGARDFALAWRDVNGRDEGFVHIEDAVGLQAVRRIRAGSTLRAGDVRSAILVERGDPVLVTYRKGPISLTSVARALESGGLHEPILVTNTASKRQFRATVSGTKQVRVGPEPDQPIGYRR